jgi:small subunit ribosomal protein S7
MNKSVFVSFIKIIQKGGNKELSELIIFNVFRLIKKTTFFCPFILFKDSLSKVKPYVETRQIKISGTSYKVPVEIKLKRQNSLVFKWFTLNANKNKNVCLELSVMKEILNSCNFLSNTIKQCNDFHKIAELNKVYIQYRY